jgi:hypothetical protein
MHCSCSRRIGSDGGDQARRREAAAGYYRFVTDHVVAPDGTVLDQRADQQAVRPYNFPWFARFLLEPGDTYLAWRVMTRSRPIDNSTCKSAVYPCLAAQASFHEPP